MTNGSDKAGKPDLELELAKKLANSESPLISTQGISDEQREEFRQAQECLDLLQFTFPTTDSLKDDNDNARDSTIRVAADESAFDFNRITTIDKAPGRIGKFRVEKEVGRGGFGIVLLAHDESLERKVALKIPRAETLSSEESCKRFQREAKAAGILSHPAIVPIYESGIIGPINYIAFAFCEGLSLDDWLKKQDGQIEPNLAAKIVAQLADAVSHAHRRGVIHRDLKPTNILIDSQATNPSNDELIQAIRITDFGLATLNTDDQQLTAEGALVGTPAYMSPEQAQGLNQNSPANDIYALGVILFQLLTGNLPFTGKSNLAIIKAVVDDPAPSPATIRPQVSRDLAAICLKCLEKKASDRYETALELSLIHI